MILFFKHSDELFSFTYHHFIILPSEFQLLICQLGKCSSFCLCIQILVPKGFKNVLLSVHNVILYYKSLSDIDRVVDREEVLTNILGH